MKCYICNRTQFSKVKGTVRDMPKLKILKCDHCGLVRLNSFKHISDTFYEDGEMNDWGNLVEYSTSCVENDLWRVNKYKDLFRHKKILDYGCGLAGFISVMQRYCNIFGYEVDPSWRRVNSQVSNLMYNEIEEIPDNEFDYITFFHVLEHLKSPRKVLKSIASKLKADGKFIIEVPNADDALLSLYDCEAFQNFTYWSCHLYLFNQYNLQMMLEQAGFKVYSIVQTQRYPLSNHLYWLAHGKPNGHKIWHHIECPEYEQQLAKMGKCDTLVAWVGKK
jgi:2-polyprenyl-3-methyl-5-hydroxy-6-metoxy-1,4-benzoquinol methylase